MTINRNFTSPASGGTQDVPAGQLVTKTVWDSIISNIGYFGGTVGYVGAVARRAADQAIANNTTTPITFPGEDVDSDGMFSPGGSLITVQATGLWLITAYMSWNSVTAGKRVCFLLVNGSNVGADRRVGIATDVQENWLQIIRPMTASDTVGISALQDSGGSVSVGGAVLALAKL